MHTMSSIVTEGRVSAKILSFAEKTYLYTGTVCKTWRDNSKTKETGACESVESIGRIDEAIESGINVYVASYYSITSGDISVVRRLNEHYCLWEEEDAEHAAEHGRVDVLRFMREKGWYADEKALHTAVRYNHPNVVKFLLETGCPVDKTVIDWGCGPYIRHELKMRSMEMAVSEENLEMVKILRTVDYPFVMDTFTTACETENTEMMEYLVRERCQLDPDLFRKSVSSGDFFVLNFLIDRGLLKDEWDLWSCIADEQEDMMHFLLNKGILPTDYDVDSAIAHGKLEVAKFLTNKYRCRPTPDAYMLTFDNLFCECHLIMYLDWLYDEMQCRLPFIVYEEMEKDSHGSLVLQNHGDAIRGWFKERLC